MILNGNTRVGAGTPHGATSNHPPPAGPAAREVPGVGRLSVPDDDPDLVPRLLGATRDAWRINDLADWLGGRGDARADLVADLAAPGVVPDVPRDLVELMPLVAGREWSVIRRPTSVRARAYPGTRLAAAIEALARERVGTRRECEIYVDATRDCRPDAVQGYLDACRRHLLLGLFGWDAGDLECLVALRARTPTPGVIVIPDPLTPADEAELLRAFRGLTPRVFAAVCRGLGKSR